MRSDELAGYEVIPILRRAIRVRLAFHRCAECRDDGVALHDVDTGTQIRNNDQFAVLLKVAKLPARVHRIDRLVIQRVAQNPLVAAIGNQQDWILGVASVDPIAVA